ncbi:MAG: SCP2 sterol-binding domain-containing protein [Candidatus Heimdallarchaeota archaeon]
MSNEEVEDIRSPTYDIELMTQKVSEKGIIINHINFNKPKIKNQKIKEVKINLETKEEWKQYLSRFMKAYNELQGLAQLLEPVAPLVFQYKITDKPEMSYWQFINKSKMDWGMGQYSGTKVPIIIHKTNFETIKKVNSGESDPIQATMSGSYVVEGDVSKLMACAPLLPLNAKAHLKAIQE